MKFALRVMSAQENVTIELKIFEMYRQIELLA